MISICSLRIKLEIPCKTEFIICVFSVLLTTEVCGQLKSCELLSLKFWDAHVVSLETVYVKWQTRIYTTWPCFPFTCRLLFIFSTHKLEVSRNFLSIRIVLSCFICSFSILRNSQLESDVWHLPYTWSLISLVTVSLHLRFQRCILRIWRPGLSLDNTSYETDSRYDFYNRQVC